MNDVQECLATTADEAAPDFLSGGGEMGARMRAHDWSKTPLGAAATWPQSLRSAVSICLGASFPIAIYWGPELALLYNDEWSSIPGDKNAWALGCPGREVWPEIWDTIGPLYERVQTTGEGIWQQDQLLPMHRHGYTEECYFNFTFSPIRGEHGKVEGIFNAVVETTFQVINLRREAGLRELAARIATTRSAESAFEMAAEALAERPADLPFFALYQLGADGQACLSGAGGLEPSDAAAPRVIDIVDPTEFWPLAQAIETREPVVVSHLSGRCGRSFSGGIWPESAETALVMPILAPVQPGAVAGVLIAGISPRRALDDSYRAYLERAAAHIGAAVANARAYEEERRRAEALAAIDEAKTAFFSNVSHEFRTPLTLMLGPLEESLGEAERLPADERERVAVAHRNGLRLLKLVNTLLDFSRIEAGRAHAQFESTDLGAFTTELAANFESVIRKAGLEFVVTCEPLPARVHVDREMWEKVVLNLLSNAFKFTFEGTIAVELSAQREQAVLRVRDTGTGIAADELPRMFERFHRIEGARGRSFEGSGIGLALVHELVKLHGGTIEVASELGRGTTFTITLPLGEAHLPREQIHAARPRDLGTLRAHAYVHEALRWLPEASGANDRDQSDAAQMLPATPAASGAGRILLSDDNADMRAYVARLLAGRYTVETVGDGLAALDAIRERRPDLVLTDIMMPKLDGFGLIRAIRDDPALRDLPVIVLSARAGEEANVEGIEAGADDYLVKPFPPRELVARVDGCLKLSRLRREANGELEASERRFRALVNAGSEAVYRMNPDWSELRHLADRGFLSAEAAPSRSWLEIYSLPADRERARELVDAAIRERRVFELEHRVCRADGTQDWMFSRAVPLFDETGEILEWFGTASDITARKHADALRIAQNRVLEMAIQDTPLDATLDALLRTVENTSRASMMGSILLLDADGLHLRHGAAPNLPQAYNDAIDGITIGPNVGSCGTAAWRRAPVHVFDIASDPLWAAFRDLALSHGLRACWSTPILSGQGALLGTFAMYYREPREPTAADLELVEFATRSASLVIEHKRAERALHDLNATLELHVAERTQERDRIWRVSRDMLGVADAHGVLLSINPAWSAVLGWTDAEIVGRTTQWFEHPDDHASTRAQVDRLAGGEVMLGYEIRMRHRDGAYRWVSWTAVAEEGLLYCAGRDVTAAKEQREALQIAEDQLRHAQKMESLGNLTGGVAHDFNNLLQVISGNLQLLQTDLVGQERAEQRLHNALNGVARGSKLAAQLLAFGRRQPLAPKVANPARLIRGMDDMLRRALGEGIEIETVIAGGLWNTFVDAAQLENALLNLAINARDAMHGHGRLTIEAGNASLDDRYAACHAEVAAGHYVMLAVSDTGSGIPPELLEQVFEPFFTTKPEGKGTGLGLSMVYGFVKQSGGHIKLYSEAGHGTTVRIYLPRSRGEVEHENLVETRPLSGGNETILVVEDDEDVRATVVEMLCDLGYRVLKAKDADSAMAIVDSGIAIDLLFTDVVMPGTLRSPDLARRARERIPGLAVLFTSGYTRNAIVHGGRLDDGVELLSKPYSRHELARKIRHVLANRTQQPAPAHAVIAANAAPERASTNTSTAAPARQRILLVEDEAMIRMTTGQMLAMLGHEVHEAADAAAASATLDTHAIDVLMTDINLPDRRGTELAAEARRERPGLRVIFASGDSFARDASNADGVADAIHLQKPYGKKELVEALQHAIR